MGHLPLQISSNEATPALVCERRVALSGGQGPELGVAEMKMLGFWSGSGTSASEGQRMSDGLEMKPERRG